MSTLSIRIPDSYHTMIKEVAKIDNISINQFIAAAIGEKLSALQTEQYIEQRAKNGSREKFLAVLQKAPNSKPVECDV